ncbi:MAG: YebC/PmpR family DNA-binding transcriptional regulator [Chloroflexota bacterium]|nr:YebC/PmpR family DNA-binding transcriptional regulator [Chloroflexota bacterium]
MSGHSKWSTIKRKKGAEDAKRGKIFTRIARDIAVAAREGGGDESMNPRLKLAIFKAKAANMPKDNIDRAIQRGTGKGDDLIIMDEVTYEGYGPDGVAILVDTLTDNKNRTVNDVKRLFNKAGGSMASAGSVAWQFEQKGYIELEGAGVDFDTLFMTAAEAGADDLVSEDDLIAVYTPREQFGAVESALTAAGYAISDSSLKWVAKIESEIGAEKAVQNMRLMSDLEELDDVQSVASNLAITDAVMEAFENA